MTRSGLHVLDEVECYILLRSRTLGRVGLRIADQLAILPVYYAVMHHDDVFRTSPGLKLSAAVLGTRVVFEADNASPGWSVLMRGHAGEVRDPAEIEHARTLPPPPDRDRSTRRRRSGWWPSIPVRAR
jgi:uncharacterized protein